MPKTPDNKVTGVESTIRVESAESKNGTDVPVSMSGRPGRPDELAKTREAARFPMKTFIASWIVGGALIGGVGVHLTTGWNPFKKDQPAESVPTASPSSSADQPPEEMKLPAVVDSPQKLMEVIEKTKIQPGTSDFSKSPKVNYYLGAVRLAVAMDSEGKPLEPFTHRWETMEAQKFTPFNNDDMIVATLFNNATYASRLKYLGIQPVTFVADKDNPLIVYHYYRCVGPKSAGIASIAITDERGKKNLTLYPLKLPECKTENGVESPQAPQQ